jgi:hypothetical protein
VRALACVLKRGPIGFVQHVTPDLDHIVGTDAKNVGISAVLHPDGEVI